jgi:hypothetical protein
MTGIDLLICFGKRLLPMGTIYLRIAERISFSGTQSRLRILGQQRMKSFGFCVQQNKIGDKEDYLVYKDLRIDGAGYKEGNLYARNSSG